MCQNLFTGRIVQNVVETILFVFFCYQIHLSVIRKYPLLSVFGLLGLRDPHFQEIRFLLFVITVGSSFY